jgi:murein DD-endopeptidase MepM/ murein hydrolase activator NlpD
MSLRAFFVAALALLLGCHPRASAEYEEAHRRFSHLYALYLDDAYVRPEMDAVVTLLEAVPKKSLDAAAARELLERIRTARAQRALEEAHRLALLEEMRTGPPDELSGAADDGQVHAAHAGAVFLRLPARDAGASATDGGVRRRRLPPACAPTAFRILLPFEARDTAFVSQGNNGRFTHHGTSRFAFDFNVAIGTPVVAVAPGVVLQAQDQFDRSADMDPDQYNFVLLDHGDGVLTEYGHLRHHGTRVRPAQPVAQGELIGYSGDTGMSTGPHVHFVVLDSTLDSLPACFLDVESGVPRAGEVVQSANSLTAQLPGSFRPAALPKDAFAGQEIELESELPLLLPNTALDIRGHVLAPSRSVIVWVRPQGVKEPVRKVVTPVDAQGHFGLALPLQGLEGIDWIGFTRVQARGGWKGWVMRRFEVAEEAVPRPAQ